VPNRAGELACEYAALISPDSAHLVVKATFTEDTRAATSVAREITAVRQLPIAVDGVRVAKGLSDAFEKQTALLDRRDASYGHHQAVVHMGTMNGARLNYATVTVVPKQGREELAVTLGRTRASPAPIAATTPSEKPKARTARETPKPQAPKPQAPKPQAPGVSPAR
jgi:hypothetical protein